MARLPSFSRTFAFWRVAARWLAILAALQIAGVGHLLVDAVEEIALGHHPDDDEAADHENDPNHQCPPGCPTCHHLHYTGGSLPPAVAPHVAWLPQTDGEVPERAYATDVTFDAVRSFVYRPPRAGRTVSA